MKLITTVYFKYTILKRAHLSSHGFEECTHFIHLYNAYLCFQAMHARFVHSIAD